MITITVEIVNETIRRLDSVGHAVTGVSRTDGAEGSIPCAAVSSLLRAAAASLAESPAVDAVGSASSPGSLAISVTAVHDERWLRGVSDVILAGLRGIESDFPEELEVKIMHTDRRV